MIDIYVLNQNLKLIGIIDAYQSLIWANRYKDLGDCEIYCDATVANLQLLKMGNYLMRLDDSMICQINRIEIDTDAEEGNHIIATGRDAKAYLDQRIIWDTATCNGNLETYIRKLVTDAVISPTDSDRKMLKPNGGNLIELGFSAGIAAKTTAQISYKNLGEKIREFCDEFGLGYRFVLDVATEEFAFEMYEGSDRADSVIFSDQYENLSSTKYTNSRDNMLNVALVGGQGDGANRARAVCGTSTGVDRYEVFVDARNTSPEVSYQTLTTNYPGGTINAVDGIFVYQVDELRVQILDTAHYNWLKANYPDGSSETIDGVRYWVLTAIIIADLETDAPEDHDTVTLREIIYHSYLVADGSEQIAGSGETESFDGAVIPDVTFVYQKDYFLGDIVHVENEYGISADARIVEIVESLDNNGYRMEPKFEYLS